MADKLKELYPNLSEEELTAAEENLRAYLLLAWEVYEEVHGLTAAALTVAATGSSMEAKVDSPQTHPLPI